MTAFIFNSRNWLPGTGTADTVNETTFMAMQNPSAATVQRTNILEVMIEGEASTGAVSYLTLAHDTTLFASPTGLSTPNSNGPLDSAAGALATPVVVCIAATTVPQRATTATLPKIPFSINTFGGIIKWNPWQPNMSFNILGGAQPLGQCSLSAFTGSSSSAQVSTHIIYETA